MRVYFRVSWSECAKDGSIVNSLNIYKIGHFLESVDEILLTFSQNVLITQN